MFLSNPVKQTLEVRVHKCTYLELKLLKLERECQKYICKTTDRHVIKANGSDNCYKVVEGVELRVHIRYMEHERVNRQCRFFRH